MTGRGGGAGHRETLTALGPSFIKAGQVLASRPDIIREDYMNELCVLQDDVPSFSDALVLTPPPWAHLYMANTSLSQVMSVLLPKASSKPWRVATSALATFSWNQLRVCPTRNTDAAGPPDLISDVQFFQPPGTAEHGAAMG